MNINVSDKAMNQIRELMTGQNLTNHYLRIGVSGDPCCGMEYYIAFDDKIADDDSVSEHSGMKVLVDCDSAIYLDGASLDFSDDSKNGGFIFHNPIADNACDCHKSCDC